MQCLNCQKELLQTVGKRTKQFCNTSCRSGYWQKEKAKERAIEKKATTPVMSGIKNKSKETDYISPELAKDSLKKTMKIINVMPKGLSITEQIQWKIDHQA